MSQAKDCHFCPTRALDGLRRRAEASEILLQMALGQVRRQIAEMATGKAHGPQNNEIERDSMYNSEFQEKLLTNLGNLQTAISGLSASIDSAGRHVAAALAPCQQALESLRAMAQAPTQKKVGK